MLGTVLICFLQVITFQNGGVQRLPGAPNTQPNNQPQGPKHAVTGVVTNAVTGEPVRRALVQMTGQTQGSTLTGQDGRFRFEDVPEGPVMFNLQKPGFFDNRSLIGPGEWPALDARFVTVSSGTNDFPLKLYPSAVITGRVTDSNGEPVENVRVQAMIEQIQQGRKQWQTRAAGSATDDDGTFRLEGLTPGRYVVFCSGHAIPPENWNGPRQVSPPIYYPDAADLTSAQAFDLQPGQEFPVDFHLRSERGYRVTGQVTGMPSNMAGGLMLENASGQNVNLGVVRFDRAKGQFTLEAVPSGTWKLAARGMDQEGHSYQLQQEFAVDHSDVTGLQVTVQPDVTIPVTVNHSAPQQEQPETGSTGNVQIQLTPVEAERPQRYVAFMQGDPPVMKFINVAAGKYRLTINSFGNTECLESATYGGADAMRDELVVNGNAGVSPITVNLTSHCGVLKVSAKADVKSAFVVVVPGSSFAEALAMPLVMPGGGTTKPFQMQFTLSPGTYQAFGVSRVNGLEYTNAEVMRNYTSQSITLGAGDTREIVVDVAERTGQ